MLKRFLSASVFKSLNTSVHHFVLLVSVEPSLRIAEYPPHAVIMYAGLFLSPNKKKEERNSNFV